MSACLAPLLGLDLRRRIQGWFEWHHASFRVSRRLVQSSPQVSRVFPGLLYVSRGLGIERDGSPTRSTKTIKINNWAWRPCFDALRLRLFSSSFLAWWLVPRISCSFAYAVSSHVRIGMPVDLRYPTIFCSPSPLLLVRPFAILTLIGFRILISMDRVVDIGHTTGGGATRMI